MSRTVTLVLLDRDGALLGALPAFDVATPWWQEAIDVVREVRDRYRLDVDVLRLLAADRPQPPGGAVTYLAQSRGTVRPGLPLLPGTDGVEGRPVEGGRPLTAGSDDVALQPVASCLPLPPGSAEVARRPVASRAPLHPVPDDVAAMVLGEHPRRAAYARPGGPAASLAWAAGVTGPGTAVQVRTWNLSAIWRWQSAGQLYWLKQLPAWLPVEPVALAWLGEVTPQLVPRVVAAGDEGRQLLAHVPGVDLYGAGAPTRLVIAEQAHRFQRAALAAVDDLVDAGVPDRRGSALAGWIRTSLTRWAAATADVPADLLATLDERIEAVTACGVPDSLVQGDAHPGNVRGPAGVGAGGATASTVPFVPVFLDWSDCFVGHPGFDLLALVRDLDPSQGAVVAEAWAQRWRRVVPECDPLRALDLLRPLDALRSAALYAEFLAAVEPAEHPYHATDVARMIALAATADTGRVERR